MEFFILGFRVYYSDETEDTADTVEKDDFDYPESMASEDFELDTAETAVAEQQKAITEQVETSSEHFEVMEPVLNGKGIPLQREDRRRRNVPKEEQRAMRCRGRSRRRFRKQQDQISADTRKSQDFIRPAETRSGFFRDERTQHFLRLLKRKVSHLLRELLPRRMPGAFRLGFTDLVLAGQGATLATMLPLLYQDNLEIEPLSDREELSGNFAFHRRIQLFVFLFGAAQLWFHPDFRFVYRHLRGKNKRKNREDTYG